VRRRTNRRARDGWTAGLPACASLCCCIVHSPFKLFLSKPGTAHHKKHSRAQKHATTQHRRGRLNVLLRARSREGRGWDLGGGQHSTAENFEKDAWTRMGNWKKKTNKGVRKEGKMMGWTREMGERRHMKREGVRMSLKAHPSSPSSCRVVSRNAHRKSPRVLVLFSSFLFLFFLFFYFFAAAAAAAAAAPAFLSSRALTC
jgi:hypothetical protein